MNGIAIRSVNGAVKDYSEHTVMGTVARENRVHLYAAGCAQPAQRKFSN